jgi:oxygen-dependent protoporphyrinogen oxidase
VSVVVVTVRAPVDRALDASGFLVARPEGLLMTACSWSSSKWAHLDRGEDAVLRVSAGNADDQRAIELADDELADRLLAELATTMGLTAVPGEIRISRWPRSLPQYPVGHGDRIAAIEADLPAGVVLAGAAYRGVGVPACVHDGRGAARRLLERLG